MDLNVNSVIPYFTQNNIWIDPIDTLQVLFNQWQGKAKESLLSWAALWIISEWAKPVPSIINTPSRIAASAGPKTLDLTSSISSFWIFSCLISVSPIQPILCLRRRTVTRPCSEIERKKSYVTIIKNRRRSQNRLNLHLNLVLDHILASALP